MPNYEFEYTDNEGQTHYFEEWVDVNRRELIDEMKSPCGQYPAKRVWTVPSVHEGMTLKEKTSGTTKYRKEFSNYARSQRESRKKNSDPNSREAISNELWTGNESFKNVLSAEPKVKAD